MACSAVTCVLWVLCYVTIGEGFKVQSPYRTPVILVPTRGARLLLGPKRVQERGWAAGQDNTLQSAASKLVRWLEKTLDAKWARVNDVSLNMFGHDQSGRGDVQNIIELVVLEQGVKCTWDSKIWNGSKGYVVFGFG